MTTLLLIVIYITFISLGLPDSMTGAAWPAIMAELNVPISLESVLGIVTTGGTVISSLFSARLLNKFGTGLVTAVSVLLTAIAIIGISVSPNFIWMILMCIPLGMGAGAVDSGLNNYVALHFKASHMNFLHCFWDVGVTISPLILSFALEKFGEWRYGYKIVAILQGILVLILFASLPLWKKKEQEDNAEEKKTLTLKETFQIKGVVLACVAFACYCGVEYTCGQWGASYFVGVLGVDKATAAKWCSLFYLGVTIGRGLCGFIAMKVKSKTMVLVGEVLMVAGCVVTMLPFTYAKLIGVLSIGLGCAPVFPGMLQMTPDRFGAECSQNAMGVQMACAYVGSCCIYPIFGLLAEYVSISLYPFYMVIFAVLLLASTLIVEKLTANNN